MRKYFFNFMSAFLLASAPLITTISCSEKSKQNSTIKPNLSILADYNQLQNQQSSENADFLQNKVGQKVKDDLVLPTDLGISFDFLPTTEAIFKVATPYDPTKEQIEILAQLSNDDVDLAKKFLVFAQKDATLIIENLDYYLPKEQNLISNKNPSDFKIEATKFKKGEQVSLEKLGIELNLPPTVEANLIVHQEYDFFEQCILIEIRLTKENFQSRLAIYKVKVANPKEDLAWLTNQISLKNSQELQALQELSQYFDFGMNVSQEQLGINLAIPSNVKATFLIGNKTFADGLYVDVIIEKENFKPFTQEILVYSNIFLEYNNFYYADPKNLSEDDQEIFNSFLTNDFGSKKIWESVDYFYALGKGNFLDGEVIYVIQGKSENEEIRQIKMKRTFNDSLPPEEPGDHIREKIQLNNSAWISSDEFAKIGITNDEFKAFDYAFNASNASNHFYQKLFDYSNPPTFEMLPPNSEVPSNFIGNNWEMKDYYQTKIVFKPNSEMLNEIQQKWDGQIYDLDKFTSLVNDLETIIRFNIISQDDRNLDYWSAAEIEFIKQEQKLASEGEGRSQFSLDVVNNKNKEDIKQLEIRIDNLPGINSFMFLFSSMSSNSPTSSSEMQIIEPILNSDPTEFIQFGIKFLRIMMSLYFLYFYDFN